MTTQLGRLSSLCSINSACKLCFWESREWTSDGRKCCLSNHWSALATFSCADYLANKFFRDSAWCKILARLQVGFYSSELWSWLESTNDFMSTIYHVPVFILQVFVTVFWIFLLIFIGSLWMDRILFLIHNTLFSQEVDWKIKLFFSLVW